MKSLFLSVFIFLVGSVYAQDKVLSFTNGYVNSGKFKVTKSISQGTSHIDVTYNFGGAYMYKQKENGKTYFRVEMPDARYTNVQGEPSLPYFNDLLAVTSLDNVSVSIVKSSYKDYSVSTLLPAIGPITSSAKTVPAVAQGSIYSKNSFYPTVIASVDGKSSYRTVPYASVSVYPLRYNPVTQKVRCYSSITYRLTFKSVDVSQSLKATKTSLEPLRMVVTNPKILDKFGTANSSLRASSSSNQYDYVIVTTSKYLAAAQKLSEWKTMLGFRCTTLVRTKWNNSTEVKNAVRELYKVRLPEYLLIIGDHEDVPSNSTTVTHPDRRDSYRVCHFYSDNAYACKDDTKYTEDVAKGRLSVKSLDEAMVVVDKIINYEKTPPTDADFYNKVVMSCYFQDEQDEDIKYDGVADLRFINTSEEIKDELTKIGYNVDRVYTRTKSSPFYPQKDYYYIDLSSDLKGNKPVWNGTSNDLIKSINDGRILAIYNGHGNSSGWANIGFNKNSVPSLNNGNKLPVFFGFCCQSGTFHISEGFTESLIRKTNGGAVGAMGFSSYGWTPTQDCFAEAVINKMYKNKIRPIGKVLIEGLLTMGTSDSYHEHMHKVTHYFGDPSMELWTGVPTCFKNVVATREGNSVRVKTGGVKDCKITLCSIKDMGASYFETYTLTDSETEHIFSAVNVPCYVTVTKHNYVPYIGSYKDLGLQNIVLSEDRTIHAYNITAGKNVVSDMTQGNVNVQTGKTTLIAENKILLKKGFSVSKTGKFLAKKMARTCNYSGNGSLRSMSIFDTDEEYDDEMTEEDGIITEEEKGVEIYPNPTEGVVYVRVAGENHIDRVMVMDISGKVLMEQTNGDEIVEFDLSGVARGFYFIKVVSSSNTIVKKILVK